MELDTGLTSLSVICTIATIYYTFTSKKYFLTVQEYFTVVKKNSVNTYLKTAAADMQKFGAGCTEFSLTGLSPKNHTNTCAKVQNLISELRRNKKLLSSKTFNVDEIIKELDDLLITFSQTTVTETKLLMANGKPLYDKLNELENHFDPASSLPHP